MFLNHMPLGRQLDYVFKQLQDELAHLESGTVFIQIRNNTVGKFGIKHFPLEAKDGQLIPFNVKGLTEDQFYTFRQMAKDSLKLKRWTHGEISMEFALRRNSNFSASVQFESNYNMSNLLNDSDPNRPNEPK